MNKAMTATKGKHNKAHTNADPITGEPGSHPVGTGVGSTGGAVAGAAIGSVVGPVGTGVGLVAGALAGGAAGKAVAEKNVPTKKKNSKNFTTPGKRV